MVFANKSQLTTDLPFSSLTILLKLIEPRLQASYGKRGTSPQGFVDSIAPTCGVGLSEFIVSINTIPGSPFLQAPSIILSKTSLALSLPTDCFEFGWIKS